jgi:hypothetical protein
MRCTLRKPLYMLAFAAAVYFLTKNIKLTLTLLLIHFVIFHLL